MPGGVNQESRHRCPYCGDGFERERELKHHYKRAMGEQLRGRRQGSTPCVRLRSAGPSLEGFLVQAKKRRFTASNVSDGGGTASAGANSLMADEEGPGNAATEVEDGDGAGGSLSDGDNDGGGGVQEEGAVAGHGDDEDHDDPTQDIAVDVGGYESFESWAGGDGSDDASGDEPDVEGAHEGGSRGADGCHDHSDDGDEGETTASDSLPVHGAPLREPLHQHELPADDDGKWLHNIHRGVGSKLGGSIMEGGAGKTKIRQFGKKNQDYRPFENLTTLLLMVFAVKHQISRAGMTDLFQILSFVDGEPGDGGGEGRRFETTHVPPNGEHFVSRQREYLPLFEVWVRDARCKPSKQNPAASTSGKVYDIPITHVMAWLLKSPSAMEEMLANPGVAVVDKEEASKMGLASEHVFPLPTRPVGNARRNWMHGTLVQHLPHLNTDGFLTAARTKVYVGELVMCDLRQSGEENPRQVPCRVVRSFFDEQTRRLVVGVRCFRNANEVLGVPHDHADFVKHERLVRVWEELGPTSEVLLCDVGQVLDRIEVFTSADVAGGAHVRPWQGEGERRHGWSFFAEGFVQLKSNKFVRLSRRNKDWRRAGSEEENYPDMRRQEVIHNTLRLKFLSFLVGLWVDEFNVFNITNPVSALSCLLLFPLTISSCRAGVLYVRTVPIYELVALQHRMCVPFKITTPLAWLSSIRIDCSS